MVLAHTDGIQLLQGGIAVGLIKTAVVVAVDHHSLWHIEEQTNLKSFRRFLIRILLAYLCQHIDYRARACATGQAGADVERHVVVARDLLQTTHGAVYHVVQVEAAVGVAQIVGHQHAAQATALAAYAC